MRRILIKFAKNMYSYYKCPQAVAERQKLTECRKKTADGSYILNSADLLTYPVEVALLDGAEEVSLDEAKRLLNFNK